MTGYREEQAQMFALTVQPGRLRIVRCQDPDDMNYLGWDVLVACPDGSYACIAECTHYRTVLALVNGRHPHVARTRQMYDLYMKELS